MCCWSLLACTNTEDGTNTANVTQCLLDNTHMITTTKYFLDQRSQAHCCLLLGPNNVTRMCYYFRSPRKLAMSSNPMGFFHWIWKIAEIKHFVKCTIMILVQQDNLHIFTALRLFINYIIVAWLRVTTAKLKAANVWHDDVK